MGYRVVPILTSLVLAVGCAVKMDDNGLLAWLDCLVNFYASFVILWSAFVERCVAHRRRPESVRPNHSLWANTMLCHSFERDPFRILANQIHVRKIAKIWQHHRDSKHADQMAAVAVIVFLVRPMGLMGLDSAIANLVQTFQLVAVHPMVVMVSVVVSWSVGKEEKKCQENISIKNCENKYFDTKIKTSEYDMWL